jgi:hypothetical protein
MTTTYNIAVAHDGYARTINGEDGPMETWQVYYYLHADIVRGNQWVYHGQWATEEEATAALAAAGDPTSNSDEWLPIEPHYGSDAWDSEAEYALACCEADAYGEPRPRW